MLNTHLIKSKTGFDRSNLKLLFLFLSSRGGLVVERLLHKKFHSATVDQILLGTMIIILNKKEL